MKPEIEETESPSDSGAAECRPPAHCSALAELYSKHGTGETPAQRWHFWDSQNPGGWSISHIERDDHKAVVAVFETSWLADQFPGDFEMC